jgi:hypothetical protein
MKDACEGCSLRKHHRQSFPRGVSWRTKNVLKLVHTNIYDLMSTSSNSQNKYFVMFIDDYNRIT